MALTYALSSAVGLVAALVGGALFVWNAIELSGYVTDPTGAFMPMARKVEDAIRFIGLLVAVGVFFVAFDAGLKEADKKIFAEDQAARQAAKDRAREKDEREPG